MNEPSIKNQTMILVEGKHEKATLLSMLLMAFPEIPVKMENIHVYETDIYDLYSRVETEYGNNWDDSPNDVNIPLLISRRNNISPPLDNRLFTNIILMFDYERHDNLYSDDKIIRMQSYFSSATECGMLYINYPMIEAYQHMQSIPDPNYLAKKVSVSFGDGVNYGTEYKSIAKENSCINQYLNFYEKCENSITKSISNEDGIESSVILKQILALSNSKSLSTDIDRILLSCNCVQEKRNELGHYFQAKIGSMGYLLEGKNFWEKIRDLLFTTINQNIEKAWFIQNGMPRDLAADLHKIYHEIDWGKVLQEQIKSSNDKKKGIIWVLCTCITFLGEYKFYWKE